MHTRSRLVLAPLVVVAGLGWSLVWGFNGQTADGTQGVLGVDEGAWRAMLNPALVAVLAAALAWTASRPRSIGALMVVVGLGAMVAGNILAFGLLGTPTPAAALGGTTFLGGVALAVAGLALLIGLAVARSTGRLWLGGSAGLATALGVSVISIAVPPAASLALLALVDALIQGPAEPTTEMATGTLDAVPAAG